MPLTLFCRRGSILSTTIFVYAATAPINGFMGGSLYAKQGGLYALAIDLIHKWQLINYSFVFMLIILTSLTLKQKFF